MWFWWFMLSCNLLIPAIQIVAGRIMWKHCPKSINPIFGYRTKRSMQNQDTWAFAHDYCGRLWWKLGWIMLLPTILAHIPFFHSSEDTVGTVGTLVSALQIVVLITSIVPTEVALKKTFHKDGTRKVLPTAERGESHEH